MTGLLLLVGAVVAVGNDDLADFFWVQECRQVEDWTAEPGWLSFPSPTASVTCDDQAACFRVTEAAQGMKWSALMPTIWLEEFPFLVVRYKARNLDTTSGDYLVFLDDDVPGRQLNAIRLCDVVADGQWHIAAVDVSTLTAAKTVERMAVQVQANQDGDARLWLDRLALTDAVPDGAEVIHRTPTVPPEPDWVAPLPNIPWVAEPGWLGNPASFDQHGAQATNQVTTFRVAEADRGMKWSWNLAHDVSLAGHRFVSMRYRATRAQPMGDYAVCVLGPLGDGTTGYRAIVPANELRCDGRWHRLDVDVRHVADELPTFGVLAVQLQSAAPDATLEVSDLRLVNARQPSKLTDSINWQPRDGSDPRFAQIDLGSVARTPLDPWLIRLRLEDWFSEERFLAKGVPWALTTGSARVASTPLAAKAELEIPVGATATEVHLLLLATFSGPEEPAYGTGRLKAIRDVDRFRIRLQYADGTCDECLPMNVATERFGVDEGIQQVVAAADPSRTLQSLVVCDRARQAAFGIAAVSLRIDGARTFSQVLEESTPWRVGPPGPRAENQPLEMKLAADGPPRLMRLVHRPSGWEYLNTPSPLVALQVDGKAVANERLVPIAETQPDSAGGVRWYRLDGVEGLRLGLEVHLTGDTDLSVRARLENKDRETHTVTLAAPWIDGYQLADRSEDAFYLVPRRGAVLDNRSCDYRERYCGLFPVQFLDTFSPLHRRGLTLRTTDLACLRKHYLLKNVSGRFTVGVEYPQVVLRPGDTFQTASAILSATNGDWHAGFDAYRRWVRSWHQPWVPRKDWFREVFNFRQRFLWTYDPLYDASSGTLHLDRAVEEARREFGGIDYLHLFDWGNCPGLGRIYGRTGDHSPFEYLQGGRDALLQAIAGVQAREVRVGLYIEGYLLQERGKLGTQFGAQWQLVGSDDKGLYWPDSTEMFVCPGVRSWREIQASTYATKVQELDVDGMYIDQFGFAGSGKDCWSAEHGHVVPSYAVATERDCTQQIRRSVEAVKPGVAVYTEESPVDVTSQYQDGSFTYAMFSAQRSRTLVPLNMMRFAVPDLKTIEILFCDKPTGSWATGVKWVFFNGEAIWLEGEADTWFEAETRAAIRRCYRILRGHRDAFTTLEPVPLLPTETGGVFANLFPGEGKTVVTFYNTRHRTLRGPMLRLPHAPAASYHDAWHDRPAVVERAGDDDLIHLEIGPHDVGCLVVTGQAAPATRTAPNDAAVAGPPEVPLHEECVLRFASVAEGAAHLKRQDRFLGSLSRFDRQCRLQTDKEVTSADVGEFAASQVLGWDEAEVAKMQAIIASAKAKLEAYRLPFPKVILLIKTTGKEEGGAAYCRANAVVLPARFVRSRAERLERVFVHELFHVLSSHNPDLRRELYAIVGFQPCPDVELPKSLSDRKITNPDAPRLDAYIELTIDGKQQAAVPLLVSRAENFDPREGGSLFAYLTFRLMVIEREGDGWRAAEREGKPVLLDPERTPAFHEQIGRNTEYVIHPDETLADNFAHLVFKTEHLPTPRIVDEMATKLTR